MGVKYSQHDLRRSATKLRVVDRLVDAAGEANLRAEGAKLAEAGKEIIRTSGFNRRWQSPWRSNGGKDSGHSGRLRYGSGPGRIDTGEMLDDFSFNVQAGGSRIARLRVGWVNRWKKYYKYQDEGFYNWPLGRMLEGMEIARNLQSETEAAMRRAGSQTVRGVLRHLRSR